MVSKQIRSHQTAGGQATGAETSVCSGGRAPEPDQDSEKHGKADAGGSADDDGEGESEQDDDNASRLPRRYGNQLGELADSERVFPAPTSHVASLNRELKALETRYFRTRLNLEKATEKNDQLRREMKKVAGHKTKQEREIAKLRHLIDRIQSERKQLEQQAITNRDYAKKIEHRFFMGTKGQSLAQCNLELSSRLRSLEETIKKRDDALADTQQERDEAQDKLAIVQRALETRLDSYELNGSLHTGLLFEISKLQDHSQALALQLAQEQKRIAALGAQLRSSQQREEELEDARTVRETWVATLEKERAAQDEQLARLSGDVQTAACEKATLLRFIHEQAEAKFQLEARVKDERAQRRQDAERAQHALQLWEDERQQLQASLHSTRQDAERQRDEAERASAALLEQQQVNATQRALEAQTTLKTEQLEAARRKVEEDFLAAKDVCRELQATIERHEEAGRRLRAEIDSLEAARRELLGQVDKKQTEERALREAMEGALEDLAALSKQRNDAAKAMSEAVTISASSLEEQQALERQVEEQRAQVEKLKKAKNLLQNAMLEQLAALRKQLHVERRQRIEAEARIKHVTPPSTSSRRLSAVLPTADAPPRHGHVEARRAPEAADWETPEPLPPPSPSPAPLPLYLSTGSTSHQSASSLPSPSSSSSSDEDDDLDPVKPTPAPQRPTVPVAEDAQAACEAPISLLELAGSTGD